MQDTNDLLAALNKYFPTDKEITRVSENDDYLIINKPAGIVVNDAKSAKGPTVMDWIRMSYDFGDKPVNVPENYQDWDKVNYLAFWDRVGVVHRLDKETSGLLLIAKKPEVFVELLSKFRDRKVNKTYMALVYGVPTKLTGEIDAPVGRLPWNRIRFGVFPGGRKAQTTYRVVDMWKNVIIDGVVGKHDFALVELKPHTGRTHQIRVHMQFLGHPVVGDELYSGRKRLRVGKALWARMCLAAVGLEIM